MRVVSTLVCGAVLGLFISVAGARAADPIGLNELPPEVKEVLKDKYPGAQAVKATREEGKHIEVTIQDKNGTMMEVVFKAETSYQLNVEGAKPTDLPVKVANALTKHYKDWEVKKVEKMLNARNETTGYTVLVTRKNKKGKTDTVQLTISDAGLIKHRKIKN